MFILLHILPTDTQGPNKVGAMPDLAVLRLVELVIYDHLDTSVCTGPQTP
jgi:hypothetical protein